MTPSPVCREIESSMTDSTSVILLFSRAADDFPDCVAERQALMDGQNASGNGVTPRHSIIAANHNPLAFAKQGHSLLNEQQARNLATITLLVDHVADVDNFDSGGIADLVAGSRAKIAIHRIISVPHPERSSRSNCASTIPV